MSQTPISSSKDELIARCIPFLEEVKNLTTGSEVEQWLNDKYGTDSELYQDLARLIRIGVEVEGWAADVEIEKTFGFSITTVYMDSTGNDQANPESAFRGDYHAHPYGEFNMVVSLDDGAALMGPNGWCYGGWTAPAPGSHHYPETKGGAIIALFFLPAGRIAYNVKAPDAK
jgi:hypothetical protein